MSFAGLRPCPRWGEAAQKYVVDCGSHLTGASVRREASYSSAETWKSNRSDLFRNLSARFEPAEFDKQEHCSCGQICIDGFLKDHRNSHGRGNDQPRKPRIVRLDYLGSTNKQLPVVAFIDETVCRADEPVAVRLENRTMVDLHEIQIAAESLPSCC